MNPQVIGAMVRLRLLRVVRDRGGLIWLLVMPMVFSYLMGLLMGDWGGSGTPTRRKIIVSDRDGGAAVAMLLAPVRAHERFEVVLVANGHGEGSGLAHLARGNLGFGGGIVGVGVGAAVDEAGEVTGVVVDEAGLVQHDLGYRIEGGDGGPDHVEHGVGPGTVGPQPQVGLGGGDILTRGFVAIAGEVPQTVGNPVGS